jgi:hypothetical protein
MDYDRDRDGCAVATLGGLTHLEKFDEIMNLRSGVNCSWYASGGWWDAYLGRRWWISKLRCFRRPACTGGSGGFTRYGSSCRRSSESMIPRVRWSGA